MPSKPKRKAEQPILKTSKKAKVVEITELEDEPSDDIGEPDDEDGGADIRMFAEQTKAFAAKRRTEQSENNVAKFKHSVEKREEALIELIRQKAEKLSSQHATSKARLKEVFASQLSLSIPHHSKHPKDKEDPTRPASTSPPTPITATTIHPLYQRYTTLLSLSKSLLRNYDALSQSMSSQADSLQDGQEWHNKSERFRALMEAGRVAKTAEVKWMVLGEKMPENARKVVQGLGMSEEESEAFGIGAGVGDGNGKGKESAEDATWAMQSRRLRKNVERLMRHVPVEEGERNV